jgi:hypothetical protein
MKETNKKRRQRIRRFHKNRRIYALRSWGKKMPDQILTMEMMQKALFFGASGNQSEEMEVLPNATGKDEVDIPKIIKTFEEFDKEYKDLLL